jgi:hypothetical protein
MRAYRCYYLDERDMIFLAEVIEAESDADALRQAAAMLAKKPKTVAVEIWHLTRLIDRLTQDDPAS